LNLTDYFRTNSMELKPVVFEKNEEARTAYDEAAATPTPPTLPVLPRNVRC
jgi:hypothetical protein